MDITSRDQTGLTTIQYLPNTLYLFDSIKSRNITDYILIYFLPKKFIYIYTYIHIYQSFYNLFNIQQILNILNSKIPLLHNSNDKRTFVNLLITYFLFDIIYLSADTSPDDRGLSKYWYCDIKHRVFKWLIDYLMLQSLIEQTNATLLNNYKKIFGTSKVMSK